MNIWMVAFAGLLLASVQAQAGCLLEQAMHNMENGYIQLRAENAKQAYPILEEQKKLLPRGNNSIPSGLQMTPQTSRRFEQLRFELGKLQLADAQLSVFVRNSRAIAKMAEVAQNTRRGKQYGEKDPDYFYSGLLLLAAIGSERMTAQGRPGNLDLSPSQDDCSVDSGLWFIEKHEVDSIDGQKATQAWNQVLAIAKKYNINTSQEGWFSLLDKIPPLNDRQAAKNSLAYVNDMQAAYQLAAESEALRDFNNLSIEMYSSHRADINAATNYDDLQTRFGAAWEARLAAAPSKIKQLEGIVRVLEEKVPSDWTIEMNQVTDEIKRMGIQ